MRGRLLTFVTGIVLAGMLAVSSADTAQRCVLAELFTSTT
jgi:hypothetical protein